MLSRSTGIRFGCPACVRSSDARCAGRAHILLPVALVFQICDEASYSVDILATQPLKLSKECLESRLFRLLSGYTQKRVRRSSQRLRQVHKGGEVGPALP